MAIVITHICDRCGHTQPKQPDNTFPDRRDMHQISVIVSDGPEYGGPAFTKISHTALWCGKCLLEKRITRPYRRQGDPEPPPPPSIEEMLREIVREEIDANR